MEQRGCSDMAASALGGAFLTLLLSAAGAGAAAHGESAAANGAAFLAVSISRGLEAAVVTTDRILPDWYRAAWTALRKAAIAPAMRAAVALCLVLSVMLLAEVVFMSFVSLVVKLLRLTPEKRYNWETMSGDLETGGSDYPMVLVQIPMYNEKEVLLFPYDPSLIAFFGEVDVNLVWRNGEQVYKLSIGATCGLSWPSDRIIIQVLDDSTDPEIKVRFTDFSNPVKMQSRSIVEWRSIENSKLGEKIVEA